MAYVLFFSLFGLLLLVGIAFAWQEARRTDVDAVFGIREAVEYIYRRMDPQLRNGVRPADIERILNWELRFVDERRRAAAAGEGEPVVVASLEGGAYAQKMALAEGHAYDGPVIEEILRLEAEYLATLGAVGDEAGELS